MENVLTVIVKNCLSWDGKSPYRGSENLLPNAGIISLPRPFLYATIAYKRSLIQQGTIIRNIEIALRSTAEVLAIHTMISLAVLMVLAGICKIAVILAYAVIESLVVCSIPFYNDMVLDLSRYRSWILEDEFSYFLERPPVV